MNTYLLLIAVGGIVILLLMLIFLSVALLSICCCASAADRQIERMASICSRCGVMHDQPEFSECHHCRNEQQVRTLKDYFAGVSTPPGAAGNSRRND